MNEGVKNHMKRQLSKAYKQLSSRVCLVREKAPVKEIQLNTSDAVYRFVRDDLCSCDREKMLSILLTAKNTVIGVETVSIGVLDQCLITPRELFKSAILSNACGIIICHNHPSGSLEPSYQDKDLTKAIQRAGELLSIELRDHLIVTDRGYYSFMSETVKEVK